MSNPGFTKHATALRADGATDGHLRHHLLIRMCNAGKPLTTFGELLPVLTRHRPGAQPILPTTAPDWRLVLGTRTVKRVGEQPRIIYAGRSRADGGPFG